jgi:hypothetical protein
MNFIQGPQVISSGEADGRTEGRTERGTDMAMLAVAPPNIC